MLASGGRLLAAAAAVAALAAAVLTAAVLAVAALSPGGSGQELVVRGPDGDEVARVALPADGRFALAYRNSSYRLPAEERFAARDDGTFALVAIASSSVAVLEEYYRVEGAPVKARRAGASEWRYELARPVAFRELRVVADDLGRRTLVAGSRRIGLWRLVPDGSVVTLALEEAE